MGTQGESVVPSPHEVPDEFAAVVGPLSDGLRFPPPFDVATSAALAQRQPRDAKTDSAFRVQIHELVPGQPTDSGREVLDTVVPSKAVLMFVLAQLLDEMILEEEE